MTMARRNKLKNVRPKALLGEAVVGAGIQAAATTAAASMQAIATKNAADTQAKAIQEQAKLQQDALVNMNNNNNALQEKSIEFTKQQNELNRDLQKEMQMNLQILAGQQNNNQLREASRIQVKCGGSSRRKLRNAGIVPASLLQGSSNNLPVSVIDGGYAKHLSTTPEGWDLYEFFGNDHEHYHKTPNGTYKSGIGAKVPGKKIIELEGDQGTGKGELALVTPYSMNAISKHSIKGYNPRDAVMKGEHPMVAFNKQEAIKKAYGINDDGTKSPVGRNKAANGKSFKCGGRYKKLVGGKYSTYYDIFGKDDDEEYASTAPTVKVNPPSSSGTGYIPDGNDNKKTRNGNLTGAWIGAAGNLGGAIISGIGNTIAANTLSGAYNKAGGILADAYGKLRGIDMSAINRDDYRAAHAMAALQAPVVNTGVERAAAERSLHRTLGKIDRNSLSGAAAQNRKAMAEIQYNDRIGQIESNADKLRQDIIRSNMDKITQVSNENANRDVQANNAYANAYLNLLQYNNDIENEKITGAAQAKADAFTQSNSAIANARQASYAGLASAISQSGLGFANTIATNAKLKNELEMSRYGWPAEHNLIYTIKTADIDEAKRLYKLYKGKDGKYANWAKQLEDTFGDKLNA